MTKYSQQDEQQHILAACPERGTFLDIGAYHPSVFSNTRALYERGWGGICIEPSPGPLRALIQEYGAIDGRVQVIAAAVGLEGGLVRMRITDDAVSTSSGDVSEQWDSAGGYIGWAWIPQITPAQILNQFGGAFDFINVDAEGCSVDIALAFLATGVRPRCWCIEHDGRLTELLTMFAEYRAEHVNDTNAVLVLR